MSRQVDAPIIRSSSNQYLKLMRSLGSRKGRKSERAFLVEGKRLVADAIDAGAAVRVVLVREDFDFGWLREHEVNPSVVHFVQSSLFDAASELEQNQGIAAICGLPQSPLADELEATALLIVDQVRDPGNLGTLLRSAAAANVPVVLTTTGTVDAFAPKVVRAGMGAHFRLAIGAFGAPWAEAILDSGLRIAIAEMEGACTYDNVDWTQPFALIVGGETEAVSPVLEQLPHASVRIPMAQNVESLNAGVAGSVLMFEASRQRRLMLQRG